jgi:transposase
MLDQALYCGIDMSADSFDICVLRPDGDFVWHNLPNTTLGFKQLLKLASNQHHFVMEATGAFHLPLCFFLHQKKCTYSVVNALQVKRYIQMNLERSKTDRKDAYHICMYGIERKPQQYQMPDQQYFECRTLNNAIEALTADIVSYTNKIYAAQKLKIDSAATVKSYQIIVKTIKAELAKLKIELDEKLMLWHPDLVEQVSSVKGIGRRAAATLIVYTVSTRRTPSCSI